MTLEKEQSKPEDLSSHLLDHKKETNQNESSTSILLSNKDFNQ